MKFVWMTAALVCFASINSADAGLFHHRGNGNGCGPTCAAPCGNGRNANSCCGNGCDANSCCGNSCCKSKKSKCCKDDCCVIAQLIYQSQTACYPKDRRKALDKLGDKFNCVCHPEIMCAFVYALNDADPKVREEAADEISPELREEPLVKSVNDQLSDLEKLVTFPSGKPPSPDEVRKVNDAVGKVMEQIQNKADGR